MNRLPLETSPESIQRPSIEQVRSIDTRAYLIGGMTIILWASAFPGIRVALKAYSPTDIALLRYLAASLALAIYAIFTRMRLPRWRDLPGFAGLGILGVTFYNFALNTGETHVPSAEASFLIASAPIFMALLAIFFLRERLRLIGWLGIILSCAGIGVISLTQATGFNLDFWALLILSGAIATSIYSIGQKSFMSRYKAIECTCYTIWTGTFFLLIFAPGLLHAMPHASISATLATLYLGIFPGAIGYTGWNYVLGRLSGSISASLLYMVPLVAALIAWIWLGEVPSLFTFLGGLLVLGGVIIVNTLGERRKREPTQHAS